MKTVFVLLALVVSACFAQNCKTTTDCGPGTKCDGGQCKVRPECPMYNPPALKAGCKLETILDEKQCPKYKQVSCLGQKCTASTDCIPGTKCDNGECRAHIECPVYKQPESKEGCAVATDLDKDQCSMYELKCQ